MRNRICQLVAALIVSALPLVATVAPARADNASTLLGLVNSLRASYRVSPMYADANLNSVAQAWSVHMAATGQLVHNPNVATQAGGGWTKLGENIGEGGVLTSVFNAFKASPVHLSNMIDPAYNLTGIGVAVGSGNTLWITEDFEAKPGATPVATVPPATTVPIPRTTTTVPVHARSTVTTAAPTTVAATTVPTTAAPTTTTTTAAPPPPASSSAPTAGGAGIKPPGSAISVPGQLASAASLPGHGDAGGVLRDWLLALSALALVAIASAGVFLGRSRRG